MKKTILIAHPGEAPSADAPYGGPLAAALVAEARAAGWTVALALKADPRAAAAAPASKPPKQAAPGGEATEPAASLDGREEAKVLAWNPASYVSACALALAAKNALGEIEAAIVLSEPAALGADLLADGPGKAETAIGEATLGPALLCRELARRFEARKSGALLLLGEEPPEDAPLGPVAALAAGAFRGLGEGLFAASAEAPYDVYGVADRGGLPAEAARFALRLLEEGKSGKSGRWLRYGGKAGIFGVF